ncbi:MAG TPA: ribosomal-protein-alanine N-acetyltransferase [Candidatus Bathyarchaeota archaeon]|nr:ribosomal-protein-alanine N-acetyltransferase [Candidatus Bathyarchaeota archaeon]
MSSFTLRRFTPEDLYHVIRINRKCLPENYSESFFMQLYRSYPESFLVAVEDDKIVGYIMCRVEGGFLGTERRGHVISIAVMPDYRRRGIAWALMIEALRAMYDVRSAKTCYLEVRVSNYAAINLYRKLGFKITRRIKGYYLDGEDAYVMERPLPLEEELLRSVEGVYQRP